MGYLLAQACAAAPVTELKPQELAAFVARHDYVVVQMTSPDLGCGYCKGADNTFDRAAALPHEPKLAYARIQWKPWREIPDFGPLVRVYGVPEQYVFRNGKALGGTGGRPASAAGLLAQVDQVIADPPFLRPKQEAVTAQRCRTRQRQAGHPARFPHRRQQRLRPPVPGAPGQLRCRRAKLARRQRGRVEAG
jgi:hypothetical protein